EHDNQIDLVALEASERFLQPGHFKEKEALQKREIFAQQTMALEAPGTIRKKRFFFAKANAANGSCRQDRAWFFTFLSHRLHDDGRSPRENLLVDGSGRFISSTKKERQPIQLQRL